MKRVSLPGILALCVVVSAPVWIGACAPVQPKTDPMAAAAAQKKAEADAMAARQKAYDDSVRAANEAARLTREAEAKRKADEEEARRRAEADAKRKTEDAARQMAMLNSVYFDYDKSAIRSDQRMPLDENAKKLRDYRAEDKVIIEGHCDERGTVEYNLALGERRASAVKQYLTKAGIKKDRLETISYGKERPLAMGSGEDAWAKNRRAEVKRK